MIFTILTKSDVCFNVLVTSILKLFVANGMVIYKQEAWPLLALCQIFRI